MRPSPPGGRSMHCTDTSSLAGPHPTPQELGLLVLAREGRLTDGQLLQMGFRGRGSQDQPGPLFDSPLPLRRLSLHRSTLCLVAPADLAVKQPFKSACLLTALSCLRGGSSFYQESWSNSLQIKAPPAPFPLQVSLSFSLSKSLKEKPSLNSPQEFLKGTTSQCKHTQKNDTFLRHWSLSYPSAGASPCRETLLKQ